MEAAHQRDLLEATVASQEAVRERIARDLHDEVGAMLSTINIGVVRFQKKADPESRGLQFSQSTKELVDATSDTVRRISRELLPASLSRFGLRATVKDLFELVSEQGGMEYELGPLPTGLAWTQEQELGLYRIIQEATNNTLKHAAATQISLNFEQTDEGWAMIYQDNGKGFSVPEARDKKSLGLKNIESRTAILGGEVAFFSAVGEGTRIVVSQGQS